MMRWLLLAAMSLLVGCTIQPAIPQGYSGPTAYIRDSGFNETPERVQLFYLQSIDGSMIENSARTTFIANGSGSRTMFITPAIIGRFVAARPQKLTLVGTHDMGATIHVMAAKVAGTFYSVSGDIEFTPQPDTRYVVKGELKKEGSSVWLEEESTGKIVGQKIVEKR